MSAKTENTVAPEGETSTFDKVKETLEATVIALNDALVAATASYTLAQLAFGRGLIPVKAEWVAASEGGSVAAFYDWCGPLCGNKSRTTLDQYMDAASIFDTLPDRWKQEGATAQIVEMATLKRVSDPEQRGKILDAARDRTIPVTRKGADGNDVPVTDTETRTRILANEYVASNMSDDDKDAALKREKDRQGKAMDTLIADVLTKGLRRKFDALLKKLEEGADPVEVLTMAFATGGDIAQNTAKRDGASVKVAITRALKTNEIISDDSEPSTDDELAALAAAGSES